MINTPTVFVVTVLLALVVAAYAGYAVGERRANAGHALTGTFYVGDRVASAHVGSWWYGASGSVAWVDAGGASHDNGWPDCMATPGRHVRVLFGEVSVAGPQGDSSRPVVWIDCRHAAVVGP